MKYLSETQVGVSSGRGSPYSGRTNEIEIIVCRWRYSPRPWKVRAWECRHTTHCPFLLELDVPIKTLCQSALRTATDHGPYVKPVSFRTLLVVFSQCPCLMIDFPWLFAKAQTRMLLTGNKTSQPILKAGAGNCSMVFGDLWFARSC